MLEDKLKLNENAGLEESESNKSFPLHNNLPVALVKFMGLNENRRPSLEEANLAKTVRLKEALMKSSPSASGSSAINTVKYLLDIMEAETSDNSSPHIHIYLKLYHMLYLAHGVSLVRHGEPLINSRFFAFYSGPVEKNLSSIEVALTSHQGLEYSLPPYLSKELSSQEKLILEEVHEKYSGYHASALSHFTQRGGSPWAKTWRDNPHGEISNESIRKYFYNL